MNFICYGAGERQKWGSRQTDNSIIYMAGWKKEQLLDTVEWPAGLKEEKEARAGTNNPMGYDELVDRWNNAPHPDGGTYGDISARLVAQYILKVLDKAGPQKTDKNTLALGISHGPKVEASLIWLLDGNTVSTIDGGFSPGGEYRIDITGSEGRYTVLVKYKEQVREISMEKIKELAKGKESELEAALESEEENPADEEAQETAKEET